jgi:MFS family permease
VTIQKEQADTMTEQSKRKSSMTVLLACVGFNMTTQVLYVWSLVQRQMEAQWNWSPRQSGLPYTLGIIFFSTGVLIGGRIQDKLGPRLVATVGGILVGLGLLISGFVGNNPTGVAIGFGVVTGLGIGFGLGSVLPASLKWFHPSKRGLISGLVLGGLGLAAVHYSYIIRNFLDNHGIENALMYLGVVIVIISALIAQFVKNPPADYVPILPANLSASVPKAASVDFIWKEMLSTKRFYIMFFLFLFSVSMGLMMLGNVSTIVYLQASITEQTAFLISLIAVMNASGRVFCGMASDKYGRANTLFVIIVLQMLNLVGFIFFDSFATLTFGFILVGLTFGGFQSIFPAATADQFGLKNYGLNYGIMYLAYGFAGIVAPVIANQLRDLTGNFILTYIICAAVMGLMILVNIMLKKELATPAKKPA